MSKSELIESLRKGGFSENILKAFEKVNRERFIPEHYKSYSYNDEALPIGHGQTISQPYTIAFMLSLLELGKSNGNGIKILEVGSGSGYVLALISEICKTKKSHVIGVERVKELAEKSAQILKNYKNIKIIGGNAFNLISKLGKFDRILISAAYDTVSKVFIEHLKERGILVMPVKNSIFQIKNTKKGIVKKEFSGFVFVPLIED